MSESACTTGRCPYGTDCTCEFYANWQITPPAPYPRAVLSGGYTRGYRDGWRQGYAKGAHDATTKESEKVA